MKINKRIILASKSPRRQELIKGLELDYMIKHYEVDEDFPADLLGEEIAMYLAGKKADAYPEDLLHNDVLVTADTIVWIDGKVLNKPADGDEAYRMLKMICGKKHEVFTGVCIKTGQERIVFSDRSEVYCRDIGDEAILHYINTYKPFDKAGSYGIQDWFGYTAVEKINGCFYNVMGLPVGKLYQQLKLLK